MGCVVQVALIGVHRAAAGLAFAFSRWGGGRST
jgi:hypothetical protein